MRLQLIALLFLVGCTTKVERQVDVQKVDLTTPVRCKVHLPAQPESAVLKLVGDEDPYIMSQAALRDLETERQYSALILSTVSACVDFN